MKFQQVKERFNNLKVITEEKEREYNFVKESLEKKITSNELYLEAISLAKKCLEKNLERKSFIEDIVSQGLTEVFGVTHVFTLEPVIENALLKGLKPKLAEADSEADDPLTSFGAGVVAIASLCLKIAVLLLNNSTAKVLILDEPLANVSPSLQERFQVFIENICETGKLQLIMVTHMDRPFGKAFLVTKTKGKSKVTEFAYTH